MPIHVIQKLIHDFLPVAEICFLQPIKRFSEIQKAVSSSALQNAERAGNIQPIFDCDLFTLAFVNQHEVRVD